MAKKNSRYYPCQRHFYVDNASPGTSTVKILNVDRCLSKINRRLYRQGRYYRVKLDMDIDNLDNVRVFTLRNDWVVQKAFQMAYQQYLNNTMDEREQLVSNQIARWEDFRVDEGVTGTFDRLDPLLINQNASTKTRLVNGEFELSKVVDTAQATRTFTWGAASASEYSILAEYDLAGNASASPSVGLSDGPYANIDNVTDEVIMESLANDGNFPPYDLTSVSPTSPFVEVAVLGQNAGAQKLSTGYFDAPCGIVIITDVDLAVGPSKISCFVKEGDYKGVHAPSMVEVATVNRKRKVVK